MSCYRKNSYGIIRCFSAAGGTGHRWWFRVVVMVVHAMAIVVMAGYSASLISYLAAGDVILPYKDVNDMIAQNNYKIGMVSRSKEISFLRVKIKSLYQYI